MNEVTRKMLENEVANLDAQAQDATAADNHKLAQILWAEMNAIEEELYSDDS